MLKFTQKKTPNHYIIAIHTFFNNTSCIFFENIFIYDQLFFSDLKFTYLSKIIRFQATYVI